MTPDERRQLLEQSMVQLAGDVRFQSYMQMVKDSREAVIFDLCTDEVIKSDRLTAAAIGELRVYTKQLDTYDQLRARVAPETAAD